MTSSAKSQEELQEILRSSPYHRLFEMDIVPTEAQDELVVRIKYTQAVERVPGSGQYHGGLLASLGDIAGAFLVFRIIGIGGATVSFSMNYIRPAIKTEVLAKAKVRYLGKTTGFIDVNIEDGNGQLIAIGRGVYALMR